MKRVLGMALAGVLGLTVLTGCGSGNDTITVLSREEGSGTRSAFVELFGIEEEDADGKKIDRTKADAEIANSTAVMLASVAGNQAAIGYVSLGTLGDTVKAVTVDGVQATADNIHSGDYKVARPFNVATKSNLSPAAQDFLNFILSDEGQQVAEDNGYISNGSTGAYSASGDVTEKVTVSGSTSVGPLMEKLREAYLALRPDAVIEIQQTDSTSGMNDAMNGLCDLGMASRELKDSEIAGGLTATVIATDGIAVIVNKDNTVDNLTSDQVKAIFTGEITAWSALTDA